MEEQVGEQKAPGVQPEKLAVHHEGEPGQGNPKAGMQGGESPDQPRPGESPWTGGYQ